VADPLFVDPDPEIDLLREDLAWPFDLDETGDLRGVSGIPNVESAMTARAITGKREIPHRPNYGLDVEDLQGGPNCEEENSALEARLLDQYQRDPRIENVRVDVAVDEAEPADTVARARATLVSGQEATAEVVLTGSGREI
jgi:hypothetical protein